MPDYHELIGAFRDYTAEAPGRRTPVRPPARPPARAPRGPMVALAAAAVAAGMLLLAREPAPRPVEGPLTTGALTGAVRVEVDGEGRVSGTEADLRLAWEAGALGVEVTPDQGVRLAVRTAEATVEVVGTGFRVERDALGTRVEVRHGRVRVTCDDGPVAELGVDEAARCRPVTAAGRLGRLRALQARGEPLGTELAEALARPDAVGPVRDELRAVQLDLMVAAGDPGALALAEALAEAGGPRALDARRVAARLAPDCARARPHLAALAAADALGADAPAWARCGGEAPPAR